MPEGVERQGIGTPATRAATIEKLVQKGFLERKGNKKTKVLLPTDKGKALITVMPEEIQSPEMTADWETKLLRIERGEMEPETFMTEIKEMISSLVTTTEAAKGANALMKNKIIGVCPNCGRPVVEREKGWFCENRECRFVLWKDNAFFKRLGKRLDLTLEGRQMLVKECFDGTVSGSKGEGMSSVTLGLSVKLGKTRFNRVEKVAPADYSSYNERINALRAKNHDLSTEAQRLAAELEAARSRKPEVVNESKVTASPVALFFNIGKATLDKKELTNLEFYVNNAIKADKNKTFTLIGSADSATGSKELNQRLSEQRMEYVYNLLVEKYKISPERLVKKAEGDTNNRFSEPELNRAVIVE